MSAHEGSAWQEARQGHGHFKRVCSCGSVIAQCRCMDPEKRVEVVERGCRGCQNRGLYGGPQAPPPSRFEKGQTTCLLTMKPIEICEHCRLLPTSMRGMKVKVTRVDYAAGVVEMQMRIEDAMK